MSEQRHVAAGNRQQGFETRLSGSGIAWPENWQDRLPDVSTTFVDHVPPGRFGYLNAKT